MKHAEAALVRGSRSASLLCKLQAPVERLYIRVFRVYCVHEECRELAVPFFCMLQCGMLLLAICSTCMSFQAASLFACGQLVDSVLKIWFEIKLGWVFVSAHGWAVGMLAILRCSGSPGLRNFVQWKECERVMLCLSSASRINPRYCFLDCNCLQKHKRRCLKQKEPLWGPSFPT